MYYNIGAGVMIYDTSLSLNEKIKNRTTPMLYSDAIHQNAIIM